MLHRVRLILHGGHIKMLLRQIDFKTIFTFIFFLVLSSCCLAERGDAPVNKINKDRAIFITRLFLESKNIKLDKMEISVDDGRHGMWDDFCNHNKQFYDQNIADKVKNKDYWAVCFFSKENNRLGGSMWFLIDKDTGSILFQISLK